MSFSRKIFVLDCGASRSALGIFSQKRGRLRLDRHVVETFPAPVGPGDEWLERTRAALPKLRERAGRGGACVLVVPGHAVLTKFLKVPLVKPEQRKKVIHFESEQNLPIALSELTWDNVVAAEHENGLEVMLAATHLKKVEPLCAAARAAGFEPRVVLPASLATLAAFRTIHVQSSRPVVVMAIGARSTTFLLLEGAQFVLRTFAFAATGLETGGPAGGAPGVAQRLAQELLRTVLFFGRQDKLAATEQIYLTGGGARLAGLREALAERLKLPVADLDLSGGLEIAAGACDEIQGPSVLTELLGAAMTELREGHSVLNLLPPLRRRQAVRRRRQALAAAALLLVGLPASVMWALRPAQKIRRPVSHVQIERRATMPAEAPPAPVETPPPEPMPSVTEEVTEPAFGVELIGVKAEPYRLQLAGYLGGPDDYLAVFVSPGQPGTMVARSGERLEPQGVSLRKFEVRKIAVAHEDTWPVYEVAAEATLHDESSGDDIVLNSRGQKLMRPQAMVRGSTGEAGPKAVREGDELRDGDRVYRVDRIRLDPPEIVIARHEPGMSEPEIRVLHAMAGTEATVPESVRPAGGIASTAR